MIYKSILTNKSLPLKKRLLRAFCYFWLKRSTRIQWNLRRRKEFKVCPEFNTPFEKQVEKDHMEYWKDFEYPVNSATLRLCSHVSKVAESTYVPQEVFRNDIEPTLNRTSSAEYLQYKSFYNRWFPDHVFPVDYFHNVDGEWLDSDLKSITFEEVISMAGKLKYPVVIKPNRDSYGGKAITFSADSTALIKSIENRTNLVIQERIAQHTFFNQFNPHGINSIRSNVYRSVSDNSLHVLNMVLRMGRGGSLDNITDGGIYTLIRKDGYLNGYALDSNCKRLTKHPDTGVGFDLKIPDIEGLMELSRSVAQKLFYTRLAALDICLDQEGKWRVIEVNLFSGSPSLVQRHGVPFFDEFTDEVRDYCLLNHWAVK